MTSPWANRSLTYWRETRIFSTAEDARLTRNCGLWATCQMFSRLTLSPLISIASALEFKSLYGFSVVILKHKISRDKDIRVGQLIYCFGTDSTVNFDQR